jgi:polysaccharide pyruvyl transferase WcaK-like protein
VSTTKNILVYGWYYQGNLGDDLFMEAFRSLFPNFNFTFVNQITIHDLQNIDAVFVGGGSFLGEPLNISNVEAWDTLCRQKIFYLGVGAETEIDGSHLQLMSLAKLIAIRSSFTLDKVKEININTIVIPDLVYYLRSIRSNFKINNSLLVLPNISVVPTWDEPHWKHAAWDYFKTEFAQFLDELIVQEGLTLNFLPLCTNFELNDELAASEIVGRMVRRNNQYFLEKKETSQSVIELMSRYSVVITQRYHGIVLAKMGCAPCLTIHHHDKLKNSQGPNISYFGLTKDKLREQFDQARNINVASILPIDRDIFVPLQRMVEDALCHD